jgi:hypothetical protein
VYSSAIHCISNEQIVRENLKISILESKLTNHRIRWNGHLLRMNEERIQKILNMNVKGKWPRGRQIRMETTG